MSGPYQVLQQSDSPIPNRKMPMFDCGNQCANYSSAGLRYGYNQRNLHALQILDSIRRIIFKNGPPDAP
jgi:hypothetical protein